MSAAPIPQGEGLALALRFHEAYERLAPSFGYETRTETRAFDPESANGRLMIAVCSEVAAALAASEARVKCLHGGNVMLQQVVDELRARAEAAEQSLAEARKDAARYRWLRDPTQPLRDALCADDLMAEELDAAIDALLPKGEGEPS